MAFLAGIPIGVILGLYWGYTGIMEKKMETTVKEIRYRVRWCLRSFDVLDVHGNACKVGTCPLLELPDIVPLK